MPRRLFSMVFVISSLQSKTSKILDFYCYLYVIGAGCGCVAVIAAVLVVVVVAVAAPAGGRVLDELSRTGGEFLRSYAEGEESS